MSFEPLDELLSFWHWWWEKYKRGNNNQERRDERLEIEPDHPEEENIDREE